MPRKRGLLRTAARTAVIAGTATSVSGRVARRQQQKFARQGTATPGEFGVDARSPAPGIDLVDRLQRLADLKASGALNAQEYAAAKAKLLAS